MLVLFANEMFFTALLKPVLIEGLLGVTGMLTLVVSAGIYPPHQLSLSFQLVLIPFQTELLKSIVCISKAPASTVE